MKLVFHKHAELTWEQLKAVLAGKKKVHQYLGKSHCVVTLIGLKDGG